MIRRIIPLVILCMSLIQITYSQTESSTSNATLQDKKEPKPVIFRDRLIMDIYHTFWMGMPAEVNHAKFDPGFNVSAIWDFNTNNKPVAFGLGLGISYYTQYSNALLQYDEDKEIMRYFVLPSQVKFNTVKMNYLNVNIPLEFRYRHENGFKFTIGARAGLICNVSQKYKGQDPSTAADTVMYKNLRMEDKMKYNVDVYTRIGWKFVDVYYNFQLTPLFSTGKGPKIYPMSVGISLSIF